VSTHRDVPDAVVARLDRICRRLPEARREEAWAGVRWRVGSKTFAHAVAIDAGSPPAYARAAGTDGPVTVLTFRAAGDELAALSSMGPPFFKPVWFHDIVGVILDDADWTEVGELIVDSYRVVAPRRLLTRLD
jgi:hypothetical protein